MQAAVAGSGSRQAGRRGHIFGSEFVYAYSWPSIIFIIIPRCRKRRLQKKISPVGCGVGDFVLQLLDIQQR
jgi:hypothetical protein